MKLAIKPQTLQKWLHGGHPVSCSNIERLCYYHLVCIQGWETTKYKFMAMRKSYAAIPAYTSKLIHCTATDTWKYCLRRSSPVTCGKTCENMCRSFIMLWYDRMKETKGFLLKIYLENHKPRIDGNTSACASTHQHVYQYSNWGYREGKHEISKRTKNSCISYFCVRIKTDAFEDKRPEYYKICSVSQRKTTNYIPTLVKSFVIRFPTSSRRETHVNA